MKKIKILIEVLHPAHVHLFKNFIKYLKENHYDYLVVSREKDITNILLERYNIKYINISKAKQSLIGLLFEAVLRDLKLFRLHLKNNFTIAFTTGTSFSAAHVSVISKFKAYNFIEDDDHVIKLYTKFSYPFTDYIVVPDCLKYTNFKDKRILYPSYHELAYLHPNNFSPDNSIAEQYGLKEKQFVIIRLSALKAHHDTKAKGISQELLVKIKNLLSDYTIIESHELKKQYHVKPWDMHHILAFAKMIISDSQTMTIEGAVLGVPAVRINTFIDKSTVIEELEKKYKLAFGFYPNDEKNIIDIITHLSTDINVNSDWQLKRQKLLADKIDLNQWMIHFFEEETKE